MDLRFNRFLPGITPGITPGIAPGIAPENPQIASDRHMDSQTWRKRPNRQYSKIDEVREWAAADSVFFRV